MAADTSLVKKAHQTATYSSFQVSEFAKCADPINGPYYFMSNYFYIQHPTRGEIQYRPYDYQKGLLAVYHENRFSVSLLPRQSGKTTTAAGYLLWYAMFVPDSTILIAAHKFAGAQEIMQRVRYAYESCPDFIRAGAVSYNKGSLEFDNGSRVVSSATTENTGRGMAISLLYVDEMAFLRNSIAKEFWTSISPTLATGGKALITSTPNSDEDQFWELWLGANKTTDEFGNETGIGKNGFKAFRSYWNEHPDRDDAWAAVERGRIGDIRFDREFECKPMIYEETLISALSLAALKGIEPIDRQGQVRWYKKPTKGNTYLVALDPCLGTGGDNAAIEIFELNTMTQVAEWQHNRTPIQKQVRIMKELLSYLFDVTNSDQDLYYSVENNSLGEAALLAISELGEENIHGIFLSEPRKLGKSRKYRKGFTTTHQSKVAACAKFKQLVEHNKLTILSKNLISELKNFISLGNSFEAKTSETDDLVSATLLIVRMMQAMQSYDPEFDAKMRNDDTEDMMMPLPFIMVM